jgi:hypothetical protein
MVLDEHLLFTIQSLPFLQSLGQCDAVLAVQLENIVLLGHGAPTAWISQRNID